MKNVNEHIQIAESFGGLKKPKVRTAGPSLADSLRVLETLRKTTEDKSKEPVPSKLGHTPIAS